MITPLFAQEVRIVSDITPGTNATFNYFGVDKIIGSIGNLALFAFVNETNQQELWAFFNSKKTYFNFSFKYFPV